MTRDKIRSERVRKEQSEIKSDKIQRERDVMITRWFFYSKFDAVLLPFELDDRMECRVVVRGRDVPFPECRH